MQCPEMQTMYSPLEASMPLLRALPGKNSSLNLTSFTEKFFYDFQSIILTIIVN